MSPKGFLRQLGTTGFAASLFILSYSCVAEGGFRVRGRIMVDGVPPRDICSVKVFRADTQAQVKDLAVGAEFEKSVIVAPGSHDYYFEVSCPGTQTFKSSAHTVTGAKQYKTPIELNTVSLTTSAR